MKIATPRRQHQIPASSGVSPASAAAFGDGVAQAGAMLQGAAGEWENRMRAATLATESGKRLTAARLETDQWLRDNASRPGAHATLESDLADLHERQRSALDDLPDERIREAIGRDLEAAQAKETIQARSLARRQQVSEAVAGLEEGLSGYRRLAVESGGDTAPMQQGIARIDALEAAGLLDAEEAGNQRRAFVDGTWSDYTAMAIQTDPARALAQLQRSGNFRGLDYGTRATRIRQAKVAIRQREHEKRQADALARAQIHDAMAGEIARIETTGQTRPGVLEQVRDTLGETQARLYARERDKALSVFDKASQLKDAAPAEAARLLEGWQESENFQTFQRLRDARIRQVRELTKDPGAYTEQSLAARRLQEAIRDEDTEGTQALAGALLAEQGRLGLARQNRRILSNAQAVGQARAIAEMVPAEAAEHLDGLKKIYGTHFPNVMQSLVAAGLPPAMEALTWTQNPMARQAMGSAARDAKALGETLPEADKRKIRETLATELAPFRGTLFVTDEGDRVLHGNAPVEAKVTRALELLAFQYAKGMNGTSAAKKAYQDVIGESYHFEDDYRLPARLDPAQTRAALEAGLEDLEKFAPVIPDSAYPDVTQELRREVYLDDVRDEPRWFTNEDESGLVLIDPLGQPVTNEEGERFEVRFDDPGSGFAPAREGRAP